VINLQPIGKTRKAHGKDGYIKLLVEDNFFNDLFAAKALFIDFDGSQVPFIIESLKDTPDLSVKLEDINDPQQASKLSSREIYLEQKYITEIPNSSKALNSEGLVDYKVLNQDGVDKGLIISIIENPHQLIAEIDKNGSSFMIPIHDDLIIELNPEKKILQIEISEGLDQL